MDKVHILPDLSSSIDFVKAEVDSLDSPWAENTTPSLIQREFDQSLINIPHSLFTQISSSPKVQQFVQDAFKDAYNENICFNKDRQIHLNEPSDRQNQDPITNMLANFNVQLQGMLERLLTKEYEKVSVQANEIKTKINSIEGSCKKVQETQTELFINVNSLPLNMREEFKIQSQFTQQNEIMHELFNQLNISYQKQITNTEFLEFYHENQLVLDQVLEATRIIQNKLDELLTQVKWLPNNIRDRYQLEERKFFNEPEDLSSVKNNDHLQINNENQLDASITKLVVLMHLSFSQNA